MLDPFRTRALNDARLRTITHLLLGQLVEGEVTAHDIARCAVLAAQLYAERFHAPLVLRIEETDHG